MKIHITVILSIVSIVNCYKLLVLFPINARSHYNLGSALVKGLLKAGHEVTFVSPFETKNTLKDEKYREIFLARTARNFQIGKSVNLWNIGNTNSFLNTFFMSSVANTITRLTYEEPSFQKLIQSNEKFDALIVEHFLIDGLNPLAAHFDAHLILFSTTKANQWICPLVANPYPPSYIPEASLIYSTEMTFLQRLINLLQTEFTAIYTHLYTFPEQKKIMEEFLPNSPDFYQEIYNISLVLINSHVSIDAAQPYVPSMVEIGGYHIDRPKKLPEDLQTYIDNAKYGVVYFSLGSNLIPSTMNNGTKKILLKVLGKLKQKVLWKWDENNLLDKPANVKLSKWFPQTDILAHPNVKLFITHGGILSTIETVYHGVPILALPVFGDQKMNAATAEIAGYGINLLFSDITEEKLTSALDKLLNDPKYKMNAKTRSSLLNDRPVNPMDLANYWIEFVIKHGGARHLRVAGINLPWYKYLMLDVVAFLFAVLLLWIYICYKMVLRFFPRNKRTKLKEN